MHRIAVLISLVLGSFLLGGCLGGGVVHQKAKSIEHFRLGYRGQIHPESKESNPTEAQIKEVWGEPDKTMNQNGTVVLRYKTGVSMAGVVPMIGVGIPLVVPTGSDYTDIYIQNGTTIKAYKHYTSWSGGYYGPSDDRMETNKFNKLGD